jgi:SAM-dependent methyltransferase
MWAAVPDPGPTRSRRSFIDRLRRRRDELVPTRELYPAGYADFVSRGDDLLIHCVTLGGLVPDERVLEIGSGFGQLARPLAGFLSAAGSYQGLDLADQKVAWCQERYGEHVDFDFQHADIFNARRRPNGSIQASQFAFPYAGGTFDLVVCTSVLKHLVTAEAERYLQEMARVLAPGGRALITLFVLDLGSRAAITQGRATLPFDLGAVAGPMVLVDPELPEEAVAFDHLWLDQVFEANGLKRTGALPGSWRGERGATYEDLIVMEKVK